MASSERHPDDITHKLLRGFYVLVGLSAAGILALLIVEPASYWEGGAGSSQRAPIPCVRDATMEM